MTDKHACHGVDVSEFQSPALQPADAQFVIARATFGTRPDKRAADHVARARGRGATAGLYHFFAPGQRVADQVDAFAGVAELLEAGDLIPWVDVESPSARGTIRPSPQWCDSLAELLALIVGRWGRAGVYISARDWADLGSPRWLLDFPLWVAHYRTSAGSPSTPGGIRPTIWQYRVGPWKPGALHVMGEHVAAKAIDHDVCAFGALPLIGCDDTEQTVPDVRSLFSPELSLDDDYWDDHRKARDAAIASETESDP
ncbi:MAG: hypothetical protein A2Y61_00670 [Chloroflexi bacterium RBG_13_60_13]|nr:MAG: hypothetical protein A2Y61_00670 [Chloroflexi bacterium RBG_13_60_13]